MTVRGLVIVTLIQSRACLQVEIECRAEMERNFLVVMWQATLVFLTCISPSSPEEAHVLPIFSAVALR
jgi:hypothetical protein